MSLDDYELHEQIGQGGMAVVYRSTRKQDSLELAIKKIRPDKAKDLPWSNLLFRFQNEANVLQKLASHNNIVTIYEASKTYIAMELLRGGTLADIATECIGDYYRSARYVLAAAKAISHAHELGIIHRDLSLRNIMFRDTDQSSESVVVTDFGLAVHWQDTLRLTETGDFVGTLAFASHEQLYDSKHVGEPTDIFSLGVILFYLCTGVYPFSDIPITTVEQAARSREKAAELSKTCADLQLPLCPIDLAGICSRCLVSVDHGRIANINDFCKELQDFLHSQE